MIYADLCECFDSIKHKLPGYAYRGKNSGYSLRI